MRKEKWKTPWICGLFVLLSGMGFFATWAADVPRIAKEELKALLGNPEVVIIDVRSGSDWKGSQEKIQEAVREDPDKKTKSWAEKYSPDKTMVLYCA